MVGIKKTTNELGSLKKLLKRLASQKIGGHHPKLLATVRKYGVNLPIIEAAFEEFQSQAISSTEYKPHTTPVTIIAVKKIRHAIENDTSKNMSKTNNERHQ
jgi:hypothetical protein